jgi:hypothetical protein
MNFTRIITRTISFLQKKIRNWKSPGSYEIPNYWLKAVPAIKLHYEPKKMPDWLTTGITNVLPTSEDIKHPKNDPPITCLPTIYKMLTGISSHSKNVVHYRKSKKDINIETRLRAGRPGFNSRRRNNGKFSLCHSVQTGSGATHPSSNW